MIIKKVFSVYLIILTLACLPSLINAQGQGSDYWIDPARGQNIYRKTVIIQANQVQSILGNWGIFGKRDDPYSGVWPKGTGHGHIHEMTMLAAAEVIGTDGEIHHVISESYSESPNRAPDGHEYWWNPLPGYANEHRYFVSDDGTVDTSSQIAHSADPTTWPAAWPGKDASWDGTWNGYFGKNQFNADDEAYYVMDDYWNDKYPYYPFPDDSTKRGLGLQCETRIFEWAHPLAQDQAFIHFRVTNTSNVSYNRNILFGAFADVHPGGLGSTNDVDAYDIDESMVLTYAYQNKGIWSTYTNILPGYSAWKFLESPGFGDDGIDNDHDGLVDEKRDNDAGQYIFGPIGDYGAPKNHWSGDENGNWNPDVDDVGSDGIGPDDPNYVGPDADGTEGNGRPDQGEPDFGILDKDESDQIGLTSFTAPTYGSVVAKNEEQLWSHIQPGVFDNPTKNANLLWIFASGTFNLEPKKTERFSTVWIFGPDEKTIYRNAVTSQNVYNYNYRFTKPPIQPIVHAVPGNNKVTIYWDDRSERSVNPIYGKNFEGYRIYRGTDPQLTEAKAITDANGNFAYYKPIAQFDLVDGIKGLHPIALGQELGDEYSSGIHYDEGTDSGLQYSYEDDDLINGVTYYYAVVGYDRGYYPGMDSVLYNRGLLSVEDRHLVSSSPSESPFSFTYNNFNQLVSKSPNTAIVTPNAPATNYIAGHTDADADGYISQVAGSNQSGKVKVNVIDPDAIPKNNNFEVSFVDTVNELGEKQTVAYTIKNKTTGETIFDNVSVPNDSPGNPRLNWASTIFDGMNLSFENVQPNVAKINALSGWTDNSKTNLGVDILKGSSGLIPANFTVEITDQPADLPFKKVEPVYFKVYDNVTLDTLDFLFSKDYNRSGKIDAGDEISILAKTSKGSYVKSWKLEFVNPVDTSLTPVAPQPGDKYVFVCNTPFSTEEMFGFNTVASVTGQTGQDILNKVSVVPNPYIVGAKWERSNGGLQGRGERKIYFLHLPAECTIRLFTQNGYLIKTIQHTGNVANGSETWDLTTSEGLEVAFGIYVYHIDAPGVGQKTGTFAVIN